MSETFDADSIGPVLVLAARGDSRAWGTLVRVYGPRVFALAQSRLHDPEASEEVAQSVFATVAIKMTCGEYTERGRFEAWLFRVAMNRVRDLVRRQKRRPDTPIDGQFESMPAGQASSRLEGKESAEVAALRRALEELSPPDREVIELRHHAQMGFKQMAEVLDEPLGTLLARHHRALRKLREIIERNNPTLAGREGADGEMETPPGALGRVRPSRS